MSMNYFPNRKTTGPRKELEHMEKTGMREETGPKERTGIIKEETGSPH